jgi:hypothetical protein
MSRKKEKIRIIRKDSNKEEYTFVGSYNILNNIKDNKSINNEINSGTKPDERLEKKIHSKKSQYKGRKILGKSMQGHSPVYE